MNDQDKPIDQDDPFDDDTIDRIANFLPVEARAGFYRELRHCRSLPQNDEMLRIIRAMQYLVLIMVKLPEQMTVERERFEQIVSRSERLLNDVHEFVDEATRQIDQRLAQVWNEAGDTLRFNIPPVFYQTYWFRSLGVTLFWAALFGLYQLRMRRLAHQYTLRLEERVSERTRIARELHDTLLQNFHGLLLRFQGAYNHLPSHPEEARKALGVALDRGAEAITAARDTVQELRSPSSVSNELSSAIAALSEELRGAQTEGLSPAVDVKVEGGERELHPIPRDEIYRITAEALRNAFRHAQAARIHVAIPHATATFALP
jgi:signal transduction histidine kinase